MTHPTYYAVFTSRSVWKRSTSRDLLLMSVEHRSFFLSEISPSTVRTAIRLLFGSRSRFVSAEPRRVHAYTGEKTRRLRSFRWNNNVYFARESLLFYGRELFKQFGRNRTHAHIERIYISYVRFGGTFPKVNGLNQLYT